MRSSWTPAPLACPPPPSSLPFSPTVTGGRKGREPDWDAHRKVIEASRGGGGPRPVIFVDTNVLMYAVGREHPLREEAREFFVSALESGEVLVSSAEVLQELLHAYLPVGREGTLDAALVLAQGRLAQLWPVEAGRCAPRPSPGGPTSRAGSQGPPSSGLLPPEGGGADQDLRPGAGGGVRVTTVGDGSPISQPAPFTPTGGSTSSPGSCHGPHDVVADVGRPLAYQVLQPFQVPSV